MSLCQFFHDGPGVGSTELCPLERPQYQALAMQTRWKPLPWSRSSAPLFKALLLPCRQGENHPHEVFFLLFNPRSSRRLSWAVFSSFFNWMLLQIGGEADARTMQGGGSLVLDELSAWSVSLSLSLSSVPLIKMSQCWLNWYPAQHRSPSWLLIFLCDSLRLGLTLQLTCHWMLLLGDFT